MIKAKKGNSVVFLKLYLNKVKAVLKPEDFEILKRDATDIISANLPSLINNFKSLEAEQW